MFLGRYRVVRVAGHGSSGRVFEVEDVRDSVRRALKIVRAGDDMLLEEFAQLARLRHPSLPRVFEVGLTTEPLADLPVGSPFFIAEWIAGGRCDQRAWQPSQIWSLAADLAGALAVIHAAGLVHGDVAPQNVLVAGAVRATGGTAGNERAMLVDLGLANATGARGTPAYMAPEAFAGHVGPRSDLYGLAATLVRLVTGRPRYEAASVGELAHRVVTGGPPPALPGLPAPLADLIGRMLARDPAARPPSALAVLDELDQLAPAIGREAGAPRARPTIGDPPAPDAWPGFAPMIAAIARDLRGARPLVIAGVAASGVRAVVDAAMRSWQLDRAAHREPPLATSTGSIDALAETLGVAAGDRAGLVRLARRAYDVGSIVFEVGDDPRGGDLVTGLAGASARVDDGDADNPDDATTTGRGDDPARDPRGDLARDRGGGDRARDADRIAGPVVAIVDDAPSARAGLAIHRIPLLDADAIAELAGGMLGARPPLAWARGLHAASGGLAVTAIELLRSIAREPLPLEVDWLARTSAGAVELRARQLRAIGSAARQLAGAIAVWGGDVRLDRAFATARAVPLDADAAIARDVSLAGLALRDEVGLAQVVELETSGLVRRRGDELAIDRATIDALGAQVDLAALAAAGLAVADRAGIAPAAIAALLAHAELDPARIELACEVAEQLAARGRSDRALALARRVLAVAPARAGLIAARAAAATGAYREAEELAREAEAAGADPRKAQLAIARAAQRAGDLDAAEALLARLHRDHAADDDIAGAYARLLVTRSRFADARAVALAAATPLAGLRAESAGLAAFYLGDLDDADRAFAALELGAVASGDAATVGRALSLRGMVAQQRGQLGLASDRYREAARRLSEVGELHAAAVAELNLGTVLCERGRASEALPRLTAARGVFAELGATTELCAAELNRGNALLAVAQVADARRAVDAALAHAGGAPHLRAFALLVAGDVHRRERDAAGAERSYRAALASAVERGDAHAQISAHVALAEAGHASGDPAVIEALCASADDRDRWTLARGRLALRTGAVDGGLARACADAAARADRADRLERSARGHAVAAQLAQRGRDGELARSELARARAAHGAMIAASAPAFRAAIEADPELAALVEAPPQPPARDDGAPLRRLLTLSRRLNTEASVPRILDDVIDTAIELTAAERGFLLLRQPDGELAVVVSRNFSTGDAAAPSALHAGHVSRSIAERAAQTGEPVVTVDAGDDERFGTAASVAALRLRSVLAVPLRTRGLVTGCIYVDHRLRGGAFDDVAARVIGELADIAAIAIENARLTEDLRRTTTEVDALNGRLHAELAERDAELVRVKSELPDRDRLHHRYDRIVGRSPAMMRTLALVDRATATSLPVVIVGESGTGKELVARALHDHGPRKAHAFVAINCSAVPEPLLESELFGHVRGAFTGADRDRRGLFEVADGGTLFLDEIADTSVAMQAKLLRVLQDGMVRRVGDSSAHKVDVRVIAASQHPLAELAAAGRFREDLRFRLEVIAIPVPALRERDGDIPLLVEQLLRQLATGRTPPRLTRAALRALGQHRWPGNVRELENALARGIAMGGDVIDLGDLPEAVAAATARPEPAKPAIGEDLRLKPALASTEQAYISAAMARAKGNQTVAARLLGLSRFGLQKKLRRTAGED